MQMTRLHQVSPIQHSVLYLDRGQSALLTLLLIVLFRWIPRKLIVATFISGGIRHQKLEAVEQHRMRTPPVTAIVDPQTQC